MKKITNILLILLILVLTGCGANSTTNKPNTTTKDDLTTTTTKEIITTTAKKEEGMLKTTNDDYIFNNKKIEVVINRDTGNIHSIRNLSTDRDFIDGSAGGNWAMIIDVSTNNPFKTNPKSSYSVMVNSRKFFPTINVKENDDNYEIIMDYDVSVKVGTLSISGIDVLSTITLFKNTNEFTIDYKVINDASSDCVIVEFVSAIVSGIKDTSNSLDLFWPNKEGKVYTSAIKKAQTTLRLSEQYPSPFSMQLMQLFNDEESLYYYVSDNTREYKEFNFGAFVQSKEYDNGTVDIKDKVSMSCTQYPYISRGNEKNIFKTTIGLSDKGSYYPGSDSYRNNLINLGMTREYNPYVREWTGFVGDTIARYNAVLKNYVGDNASDKVVKAVDNAHIDSVVLFGWHKGGFDYKYPDYEIMEGEGYGKENFKELIANAHANGDKVLPYLNAHITAINSEWGQKTYSGEVNNMLHAAIKKIGFNSSIDASKYTNYMYYEFYGTDIGYYATCPCCDEFVNQIKKVVTELADCNVDGLWMDQMMEMPANLCYDESHGHATPATAYGEGYEKMYSAIDEIFKAKEIEYLIFAEGVTDAWIEYIDIPGYMWARHLFSMDTSNPGDSEYMRPDITAYTMPCTFLGIESDTAYNHARAFLFGSPLKSGTSTKDITVTELYLANKDIYFYGRYMDKLGLTISSNDVFGSIIMAENRVGIQLYNNSSNDVTVTVSVDLLKLGLPDKDLMKLVDLINNVYVKTNDNTFEITIAQGDIAALAWSIQ